MNELALKWFKFFDFENTFEIAKTEDGERFVEHLCKCEELYNKYQQKGISDEIFTNTVADFKNSANLYKNSKGTYGITTAGAEWLELIFSFKLFRLGRLQFCITGINYDVPEDNLKKGDSIIDVHIPRGDSITEHLVTESFDMAKEFFKKYFPDYKYDYYICHSWMLDDTLYKFLDENSNILKFKSMWQPRVKLEMDSILYFVFYPNGSRDTLDNYTPTSSFAKKVKEYAKQGGVFYNVLGTKKAE